MKYQSGFSIIEVVIGAGLMSLVAMGFGASLKNGTIGQKSLQAQDDARVLTQNMQSLVSNPAACAYSFGGLNPVSGSGPEQGTSVSAIRDRGNVAKFEVTTPRTRYGSRGIELEGLLLGGAGTDRSGVPRWTSTGTTTGIALVRVTWRQTGYKVDGVGAQDLLRFFLVNVTSLNASNQIVSCTAEALGSLSSAFGTGAANYLPLWQTEASLSRSAVYQQPGTGNIGIGTSSPSSLLEISGEAKISGAWNALTFADRANPALKMAVYLSGGNLNFDDYGVGPRMVINRASGNVGIGTGAPGTKLDVAGPVRAQAYYYTSDARLKTAVETLDGLALARKLRGVRFEWIAGHGKELGFIAQEVEGAAPELVLTDAQGMKSVKYGNVTAILVEAVKAQDRQLEELRRRNEALERRLEKLERK